MQRKINDNYMNNPMRILNKEENEKYNKEVALKNQKHSQAFKKMLGSDGCRRVLGGVQSQKNIINHNYGDKITSNDFNITQKSITLNKNEDNQVPYYGKRHFRFASSGRGKGLIYVD